MAMASGVRALKQRTERAAFAGHTGLAAQRSCNYQNICVALACAEQVGDKDFSLMPDDRGAALQLQMHFFVLDAAWLFVESDPDLDLVLIIVLVLAPASAGNSSFVVWSRTR